MCLLTVTPEYKNKSCTPPNRVVITPKPVPAEPTQPTPVPVHYVTCEPKKPQEKEKEKEAEKEKEKPKETGQVTENELLKFLLAAHKGNHCHQEPAKQEPPEIKPREEHHYHHYPNPNPPIRRLRRRSSSSASSVSVRSFESVRRKVGGLWRRVTALERDRERKEWLAEAAAAASAATTPTCERRKDRSRSPRRIVGGLESFPDWYGRGRPLREHKRETRCRVW